MSRQNPSYSGQPRRSTGSSTHHKSSRKQYTMYREPLEKDPKPRRRRSTDGVTAAQLSKLIVPVLLAAAVVFLLLFFWQWTSYQKSDEEYQTLRAQLVWMDTSTSGDNAPASRLDFTVLKEQNPDVTAWLSVPGLELSLPVVQNEDSNYYLRRSFSGASSNDGCLIRPSWDSTSWADGLCHVIHGHNIHNGAMFGKLDAYRKQDFYSANPTFTLYTPDGDYLCRIFSAHDAKSDDPCYALDYSEGEDYDAFLRYLKELSLYDTGVDVPSGSHILTLSTCRSAYASNNQRFVVHAIMEPINHAQ